MTPPEAQALLIDERLAFFIFICYISTIALSVSRTLIALIRDKEIPSQVTLNLSPEHLEAIEQAAVRAADRAIRVYSLKMSSMSIDGTIGFNAVRYTSRPGSIHSGISQPLALHLVGAGCRSCKHRIQFCLTEPRILTRLAAVSQSGESLGYAIHKLRVSHYPPTFLPLIS